MNIRTILFFILLWSMAEINGQLYVTGGSNLSRIYIMDSGWQPYNYGLGYNLGVAYTYELNKTFSSRFGVGFIHRKVNPATSTSLYTETFSSKLVTEDQNMLAIPIDIRVNTCKGVSFITGFDFNFFLNDIDSEYEKVLDPNLKFGLSYGLKRFVIDAGYTFSIRPFREQDSLAEGLVGNRYKNESFFINIAYRLFN